MRNVIRLFSEMRRYWRVMALIGVLTLASAAVALPAPLIVKHLIDNLILGQQVNLPLIFCLLVGIAALNGIFQFALTMAVTYIGQRFKYDIRRKLYAHMQTLSLGFFEKSQTGKLMSNITNDVAALDNLISGGFVTIISDTATLAAVLFIVFQLDWRLALVALAVYPLYVINYLIHIGPIKESADYARDERDIMLGDLQEKLAGAMVVKSYAKERAEIRSFTGQNRSLLNHNVRLSMLGTRLWTIAEFLGSGCGTALILWFGGREVLRGNLTPGALVAFLSYITNYLYSPTVRLIQLNEHIARANAALRRVFATLDTDPTVRDMPDSAELPPISGAVRFRGVHFEYELGHRIIRGVDLDICPGQMIAFVGGSGSGKTTMINLLARHYDVSDGAITVDGFDLRSVTLDSLRKQVGVVIQETILFNTTIRENIRYGRLDATDDEIREAAAAANIAHVIEALPKGYDTRIGEEGVKLSGGEKQRVAIARAILSDPRILILDEATSSLDSAAESLIQEALERLMRGRTSFIIAHRLSTIVNADMIVVMENGRIAESGPHQELLQKGGRYAALYYEQFKTVLKEHSLSVAH